jgi:hypothetical protein
MRETRTPAGGGRSGGVAVTRAERRAAWVAGHAGTARAVDVRIDELVLHGFPRASGAAMGDAVARELTRLVSMRGVPERIRQASTGARMDGGSFQVARRDGDSLGSQVASAIYGASVR